MKKSTTLSIFTVPLGELPARTRVPLASIFLLNSLTTYDVSHPATKNSSNQSRPQNAFIFRLSRHSTVLSTYCHSRTANVLSPPLFYPGRLALLNGTRFQLIPRPSPWWRCSLISFISALQSPRSTSNINPRHRPPPSVSLSSAFTEHLPLPQPTSHVHSPS